MTDIIHHKGTFRVILLERKNNVRNKPLQGPNSMSEIEYTYTCRINIFFFKKLSKILTLFDGKQKEKSQSAIKIQKTVDKTFQQ